MIKDIEELLNKDPFQPFRIVLTSGQSYDVLNSNLVAWGESQMTVYFPKSDRWASFRINQIVSIEILPIAA